MLPTMPSVHTPDMPNMPSVEVPHIEYEKLAEDYPLNQELAVQLLEKRGHAVVGARFDAVEAQPPRGLLKQLVARLMKQIRELSLKLSPSMLDDMGLLRTLLWYFEQYTAQTGIQVHFSQSGLEKRFPSEVEITAYRIIQEALTNVARYAKVDRVEVAVDESDIAKVKVGNPVTLTSPTFKPAR